ncbi:MAG: aminotransferase class I/II-fold pyridoxal phosphate-dependent enzyme, partial [Synechococcaceae cyanobacterium RL_1_2]|nr:aminotransferase class I/II-fold pyridoxal phosphate-dependent enzyme [Synechococcaceae cyanobacterium RL_1_2]
MIHHLVNAHIKNLPVKTPVPKPQGVIRLDKGEFPYGPLPEIKEAIAVATQDINRYPAMVGGELREDLADYVGVNPDQIIIGNGSDDLIELILKVFVQPGQEVLLPRPTFFVYDLATQLVGGKVVDVGRTADFDLDLEDLMSKISDRSKLIFIANPNNPTANLVSLDRLKSCLDQFPQGLVVVDECYFEFSGVTVVPWLQDYPNLIVLRSLSKSFGLAGLRVGYAIANPITIDYLYRAGQIFVVNKLALAAGQAVIRHRPLLQPQIETIFAQRTLLSQALTDMGCKVYD